MSEFKVGDIVIINSITDPKYRGHEYEIKNYSQLHGKCGVITYILDGGVQPYIVNINNRKWYVHDISLIEEENE